MASFVEVVRDVFAFVEFEYGFRLVEFEENSNGGHVVYINRGVGVGLKLLYEFSDAFIFIFVYRLIDGNLRDNPLPIRDDTEVNCFDFNDYLTADFKMKPAYEYGESSKYYDPDNGLRNYAEDFAARLRRFGKNILTGDLSMLPEMESIIKRRARGRP